MKKSLHINDGRRSRMRHASEIARRKADRARKFGTPKPRALNEAFDLIERKISEIGK